VVASTSVALILRVASVALVHTAAKADLKTAGCRLYFLARRFVKLNQAAILPSGVDETESLPGQGDAGRRNFSGAVASGGAEADRTGPRRQ